MSESALAARPEGKGVWHVLKSDKRLLLFPALSCSAILLMVAAVAVPFARRPRVALEFADSVGLLGFLLAMIGFFLLLHLTVVFFNTALASCALVRFRGGRPSVLRGLGITCLRLPQLLGWSLLSTTVGAVLKAVEKVIPVRGDEVGLTLGMSWSVATSLVVPVIAAERAGPLRAVRRSAGILKKTWGERLVSSGGAAMSLLAVALPGFLLAAIGTSLPGTDGRGWTGLLVTGLGLVWLLLAWVIFSAVQTVFVAALYHYADGGIAPVDFDEGTLRAAFVREYF